MEWEEGSETVISKPPLSPTVRTRRGDSSLLAALKPACNAFGVEGNAAAADLTRLQFLFLVVLERILTDRALLTFNGSPLCRHGVGVVRRRGCVAAFPAGHELHNQNAVVCIRGEVDDVIQEPTFLHMAKFGGGVSPCSGGADFGEDSLESVQC